MRAFHFRSQQSSDAMLDQLETDTQVWPCRCSKVKSVGFAKGLASVFFLS